MKKILLSLAFISFINLKATGPEPETAFECLRAGTYAVGGGVYKTITDKDFWKSALTITSAFNMRFFFPSDGGGFSLPSIFGNNTLRSSLCCGVAGSVLNRSLSSRHKSSSAVQVFLENPFIVGIFAHTSVLMAKTYWNSWNSSMKDNPALWIVGATGAYLGGSWIYKRMNQASAYPSWPLDGSKPEN